REIWSWIKKWEAEECFIPVIKDISNPYSYHGLRIIILARNLECDEMYCHEDDCRPSICVEMPFKLWCKKARWLKRKFLMKPSPFCKKEISFDWFCNIHDSLSSRLPNLSNSFPAPTKYTWLRPDLYYCMEQTFKNGGSLMDMLEAHKKGT